MKIYCHWCHSEKKDGLGLCHKCGRFPPTTVLASKTEDPIDELYMDELRKDYRGQKPHKYEETVPYNGCARCGYGPGAAFHNMSETEHKQETL